MVGGGTVEVQLAQPHPKYSYNEDYQRKLAALMVRDPVFLLSYPDVIDPLFFDYEYLASIVRITKEFTEKFSVVPTRESLQQSVVEYCTKFGIDTQNRDYIIGHIDFLYNLDLSDAPSVREKIVKFGKRQALRAATVQCAELVLKEGEYDKARNIIDRALRVGEDVNDLGMNFFTKVDQLPSLIAADSAYSVVKRVPTGFPTLDKMSMGGPGRRQVWVVLGMAGGGKTAWKINIGAAALKRGLPVFHYTLGDLQEVDVGLRYAARLTGMTQEEVMAGETQYYERAARLASTDMFLLVKYYPSQVATVNTIRAHLSQSRAVLGVKPALIIVDYADELAEMRTDNLYYAAGQVYSNLNQLASDFDSLVWTGSQVNRYSPKETEEDLIKKENVSDSWMKAAKADGMVSVNQTQKEYQEGRGRVWVDKVRRGKSFRRFPVTIDLYRCLIRESNEEFKPPPPAPAQITVPPPVFGTPQLPGFPASPPRVF